MKFKCPQCDEEEIEEVMIGAVISQDIINMTPDGNIEYGEQTTNYDGDVHYTCKSCGWILKRKNGSKITSSEELLDFLRENDML